MCSKKLKVVISLWLPFYESKYGSLDEKTKAQLLSLSPATIDRLLKPFRLKYKRRGLRGTRPGYLLKNQIPIKTDHWDVTQPGFLEADTVAHGGDSTGGDFVWSITLTDIATGWTEIRATWNKGAEGVVQAIEEIEKSLIFPILGFDCDNGSEFLNWHLKRYFCDNRNTPVQFTRSRPYKKNDNAHVEQKNWTHVRQLLGYDRFDKEAAVPLINELYRNEWSLYQNHFVPTIDYLMTVNSSVLEIVGSTISNDMSKKEKTLSGKLNNIFSFWNGNKPMQYEGLIEFTKAQMEQYYPGSTNGTLSL